MKIRQLDFTKENIFKYAVREDVYIIQMQKGRSSKPRPFGLAFKSIKNISLVEIVESMNNKKLALVEVTIE